MTAINVLLRVCLELGLCSLLKYEEGEFWEGHMKIVKTWALDLDLDLIPSLTLYVTLGK